MRGLTGSRVTEERARWEFEIGILTDEPRHAWADAHEAKALDALRVPCDCCAIVNEAGDAITAWADPSGQDVTRRMGKELCCPHRSRVLWHTARARGQRERFDRIANCSVRMVHIACSAPGCGRLYKADTASCAQHRVCVRCRGQRARKYRQRFTAGRKAALSACKRAMRGDLPGTAGRGRRWREAFVTLTQPASGDAAADVRAMAAAVPRFVRRLRGFLMRARGLGKELVRCLPTVRALEITPGAAGGHAHVHMWLIAPFVHHAILRRLWADSLTPEVYALLPRRSVAELLGMEPGAALELEHAGQLDRDRVAILEAARLRHDGARLLESLPWPVLDVRRVTGDPSNELVKYMLKDMCQGELISPFTFADLYGALEGRRTVIASKGFWREAPPCECPSCHALGTLRLVAQPSALERAAAGRGVGPPFS